MERPPDAAVQDPYHREALSGLRSLLPPQLQRLMTAGLYKGGAGDSGLFWHRIGARLSFDPLKGIIGIIAEIESFAVSARLGVITFRKCLPYSLHPSGIPDLRQA